jgi:hypothetical protein
MHKTPAQTKINKNNNEGQRFVLSCKLCVNYCVAAALKLPALWIEQKQSGDSFGAIEK